MIRPYSKGHFCYCCNKYFHDPNPKVKSHKGCTNKGNLGICVDSREFPKLSLEESAEEFQSRKIRDGWSSVTQRDFFGREKVTDMLIEFAKSDAVKKYHLSKNGRKKTK